MECGVLKCVGMECGAVQYGAVECSVVKSCAMECVVQCSVVQCGAAQWDNGILSFPTQLTEPYPDGEHENILE